MKLIKALGIILIPAWILSLAGCCNSCDPEYTYATSECECRCLEGFCGPDCTNPVLECENGTWSAFFCSCECETGWCGPQCDIEILDCQNNGTWNTVNCECDCPQGFSGPDCSLQGNVTETDDYMSFTVFRRENGSETELKSFLILNNNNGTFEGQVPGTPSAFYLQTNEIDLTLQISLNLVEGSTYSANFSDGVTLMYTDTDPSVDFNGASIDNEGQVTINSLDPYVDADFEFLMVDNQTMMDTIIVRNGRIHY